MISLLLAICVGFQEPVSHEKPLQFSVTHDGAVGESLDGRLYIMLTRGKLPLIGGPNWFNPEPFFALDVVGWLANTFEGIGMGAGHGRVFNVQVIREMDESIAKRLNLPHLQFKASKPIE